jgi:hypothetical protein
VGGKPFGAKGQPAVRLSRAKMEWAVKLKRARCSGR